MKFILSKDGIKREIETPFAMCIGRDDLETLIRELQAILGGMDAREHSYGWVRVDPSHPCDAAPNTKPLQWTDTGLMPPAHRGTAT